MKTRLSRALAWLVLAVGLLGMQAVMAQGKAATPEANTKAFYAWYIKLQTKSVYPLTDNGIYTYVAKDTVDRLRDAYRRNEMPGDADYFTKVQDYDEKDWAEHTVTRAPILLEGVAVVPVTFGSKDKVSVLVFLRKLDDGWKITKVEDTLDFQ
ncbi:hypothetical protein ACS15_1857 [Ralstonia insidiosa]|uniref:DUF3828 domain-containing protein n=1 Tax=Ralstonia insidiosa TaxID=190721 RepID=A0AAC9FS70_9RALS|nr:MULTISPECIES: DUF3828 domain-containing protein [Ralstonia]ANH74632.1 hypothetical protein ACS15_1857 [Ralstonia insidiosa]EPX98133.1 hypothetical protein C404_09875 [Ralstonia sp. AU12-08]MBY4704280.1 YbjP/YqhG family protein [Ralstonia insidiosa]GAQ30769.1 hypothetical protein SAMD00023378_4452 [Ralstonia sp. NT80]